MRERKEQERDRIKQVREKPHKKNILVFKLGLSTAVLLLLTFAGWQWRKAERSIHIAEQERQHAVEQSKIAERKTAEAKQQKLEANYNLAKLFETKALHSLEKAEEKGSEAYKQALLFASAVLEQAIEPGKSALKASSIDRLFTSEVFYGALAEQWVSSTSNIHQRRVSYVSFSPDGKKIVSASSDKTIRLRDTASGEELAVFKAPEEGVSCVALSPDGRRIASASGEKTIRVWDTAGGKEPAVLKGHEWGVESLIFSPDGKKIASASWDKTVRVWDAASGREIYTLRGHTYSVNSVSFSPDGRRLVSASSDKTVRVWDVESGREISVFNGHTGAVKSVAFSPDGRYLASASGGEAYNGAANDSNVDCTICLWDIEKGRELKRLEGHEQIIFNVSFSPDGRHLASASWDGTIRLWDIKTGKEIFIFKDDPPFLDVAFSPDGHLLAAASDDETVRLWNIDDINKPNLLKKYKDMAINVSFTPDGGKMIFNSWDGTARSWDIESDRQISVFRKNISSGFSGRSLSVHPVGDIIASASKDKSIRLWEADSGRDISILKGHTGGVTDISFSPDGTLLASASGDETVRLWGVESGREISVFSGHSETVTSVAFSPDGRHLVSASDDYTIRSWDIENMRTDFKSLSPSQGNIFFSPDRRTVATYSFKDRLLRILDIESGGELSAVRIEVRHPDNLKVIFRPNRRQMAYVSFNNTIMPIIRLINIETGNELSTFKGHMSYVNGVTFSLDGKKLASASNDKNVRIWDVEGEKELAVLKGHTNAVNCVAFSPDGKKTASGSSDHTVRIWDTESGQELAALKGHRSHIISVVFSPDGKSLISYSQDNVIRIWNTKSGKELLTFSKYAVSPETVGHGFVRKSVALTPDGRRLAFVSRGETVRLLELESGKELAVLRSRSGMITDMTFTPDGEKLILTSMDNTVRIWDTRINTLFLQDSKPTTLYRTFMDGVKLFWHVKRDEFEFVPDYTPTLYAQDGYNFVYEPRFRSLLAPPPPGQSKFDQVLEWAEKQQER